MSTKVLLAVSLFVGLLVTGNGFSQNNEDKDVVFGPNIRKNTGMTVEYKDKVISASQVGQTTAIRNPKDGEGKQEERVPVALWTAIPFHAGSTIGGLPLGSLDMGYKDFYFPKARVIKIEDTDDGFTLLPSKESLVPIYIEMDAGEVKQELLVRAANVTWVFKKKGMKFRTLTTDYVTTKAGAKVSFLSDGVKFDGVTATERKQEKNGGKK